MGWVISDLQAGNDIAPALALASESLLPGLCRPVGGEQPGASPDVLPAKVVSMLANRQTQ